MTLDCIEPVRMKISSPYFDSLFTPEFIQLHEYFKQSNYQLRLAGGVVRDLLMDLPPSDIDLATDATPKQIKELLVNHNQRIFNKKGEEHGTVSCRINNKVNFEITTLRIDLFCDGRHARVEFTKNWQLDANRRDLTINSLFLDLDGTIIDYFGGIVDLKKRRIAFVGDATQRIQEDYLRILRFFRFFGRIAPSIDSFEEPTLQAIIANRDGLASISGERIWSELKKISVGRLADEVMTKMLEKCGLGPYIGLNASKEKCKEYRKIFEFNTHRSIQPMTILCSFFSNHAELEEFHKKCKLSRIEKSIGDFIISHRERAKRLTHSTDFYKMILDEYAPSKTKLPIDGKTLVLELAKYCMVNGQSVFDDLHAFVVPTFPVSGRDLMEHNLPAGPIMQYILTSLYDIWKEDTTMTKDDLLRYAVKLQLPVIPPKKRAKLHDT